MYNENGVQAAAKARVTNDLKVLEQHLTMATFLVRQVSELLPASDMYLTS